MIRTNLPARSRSTLIATWMRRASAATFESTVQTTTPEWFGVVAQCSKFFNYREWEVFVGVEPGHASRLLVLTDLIVDLGAVGANKSPCVGEVLGTQGGIAAQQVRLTDSQPA